MEELLKTMRPSLPSDVTPQHLHNKLRHIRYRHYSFTLPLCLSKHANLLFNSANSQENEEKAAAAAAAADDDDDEDQSVEDNAVSYPYLLNVLKKCNKDGKIVRMFEIVTEKKLLDVDKLVALESQRIHC